MKHTAAFIGSGNMGGAFARAAARAIDPKKIVITDYAPEKAEALAKELGCSWTGDNIEAVKESRFIILCVKPQVLPAVLEPIAAVLREAEARGERKVLVSIAAGITIAKLRSIAGERQPIIRVMPNTPALIGSGLMILTTDGSANEEEMEELSAMAKACGDVCTLDEKLFDQATVISSCSPAYAYMFIEALADAGAKMGLDPETSLFYAARSVLGSAAMVLETGISPDRLCSMVCSPGGSTIEGVNVLREKGLYSLVEEAANASYKRNIELGK